MATGASGEEGEGGEGRGAACVALQSRRDLASSAALCMCCPSVQSPHRNHRLPHHKQIQTHEHGGSFSWPTILRIRLRGDRSHSCEAQRGGSSAAFGVLQPRTVHEGEVIEFGNAVALHTALLLSFTHVMQVSYNVGNGGAKLIGEGLKVNSSLQELELVRPSCVCLIWMFLGRCRER
jgi:hypothetical protein